MGDEILPPDMQAALDQFDNAAENIIAGFVGPLDTQKPPSLIYHYTGDLGLRGILESGKLWLTDIFGLNDPSELTHGFDISVHILRAMAEGGPPEHAVFAKHFAAFRESGVQESAHYFVCSLSAHADELGQWRAYADDGRGYALVFDGQALEDAFTKEGDKPIRNNATFPVTYDDALASGLQRQIIERALTLVSMPRGRNMQSKPLHSYMKELSISLTLHALRTGLFFKHTGYINEKEYRFLQIFPADVPAPEVLIRSRPYSLVRYREFDWRAKAPGALKKVIVGPGADKQKAFQFAADCLRFFHSEKVEIGFSKIPYRAG